MTTDFEMDKMEADFRQTINKTTASRRKMAEDERKRLAVLAEEEQKQKKQEALEYVKNQQRELRREKAWDRLYMAAVFGCLMCGLFCSYRIGIIPLSITVPAEVVFVSIALVCLWDAIWLFMGSKRK